MRKQLANEKGLTLIELLAVFTISSILIFLISSVLVGVQKQHIVQSDESESIFNVTYAAKVITKDFRKAEKIELVEENNIKKLRFTLSKLSGSTINEYYLTDTTLYKNASPLVRGITEFLVTVENDMYMIEIEDRSGKTIKTELIKRK